MSQIHHIDAPACVPLRQRSLPSGGWIPQDEAQGKDRLPPLSAFTEETSLNAVTY